MTPSSARKISMYWKIPLLTFLLCAGCVSAKLSSEETTVTVIGDADVRICHERDETTVTGATLEESDHCVEIQGEGISEAGAGVLNTLFFPFRYLGQLLLGAGG